MARVQATIEFNEATWKAADQMLAKLDHNVRGPAIGKALRAVGTQINRQVRSELPKPGYPGDRPGLTPLRDTLAVKTVNYDGGMVKVVVIGYRYPQGAHGHLLEGGHDVVNQKGGKKAGAPVIGYAPPYEYLIRVVRETKPQQSVMLINSLKKILAKQ